MECVGRCNLDIKDKQRVFDEVIARDTEDLMGLSFDCVCGQTHGVPIEYLTIKKGAVREIKERLKKLQISGRGAVVYDKKIETTVVRGVLSNIERSGLALEPFPVGDGHEVLPAEVELSKRVADTVGPGFDFLVSVGSGVVSDLVKYASSILEKPYVLVATAPSMNGYTSSMAALTDMGIKKTLMVPPARAIFADIATLTGAPVEMVRSGLGDIVSKSICNADWKLSELVKKTYFCPLPFRITDKSEPLYLDAAEEIGSRTERGIRILTDGVMRSGLSMTVIGTSTPSSGAEHFLSHYWDLTALIGHKVRHFHGVQVGVATILVLKLYDFVRNFPVHKVVSLDKLKEKYPSEIDARAAIDRKFGRYAKGVNEEYFKKHLSWKDKRLELEGILDRWDSMWSELSRYIRPVEPVKEALSKSGAAVTYAHLGKSREEVADSLLNAPFIRSRYSILDLANDLGIMQTAVEKIL
jgi:glycerol-1-phosphate dehydrogenase [NAD(P)+]